MAATTVAPHACGICDGPLTFNGVSAEYATWTCPACGWWHIAKDCCEDHPIPAMTPAQQEQADAEAALTAAVLAYRADPTPENAAANVAAARRHMGAFMRTMADEYIEQQSREPRCAR